MRGLLREPLLHFLVGGGLLFALYATVADDRAVAPGRIVVSEGRIAALAATFERTWLRAPTRDELDGLIREHVNEEVLYREGLALGLDRDDSVIRRRLRQKVEFLNADLALREAPSRAELEDFLSGNRDLFEQPARVTFQHVFVRPGDSPAMQSRATLLLAKLRAGEPGSELGDPTLLPKAMRKASEREIGRVFGTGFAGDVMALGDSGWSGPIASSYGLHLVRVDERVSSRMPELAEVREQVERGWGAVQRAEESRRFLQELRDRYDVEIHRPSADSGAQPDPSGG